MEAEEKTLYGQVEEATLSSLRPATVYQLRVAAENELGRSKEGRVLQVTTCPVLVFFLLCSDPVQGFNILEKEEFRGEFYLLSRFDLHLVGC